MSRLPDRSDSPAFYDPEHPDNNRMPRQDYPDWWVEILCDDGEQFGYPASNCTDEEAKDRAWASALEFGYRPVEVESCEVME